MAHTHALTHTHTHYSNSDRLSYHSRDTNDVIALLYLPTGRHAKNRHGPIGLFSVQTQRITFDGTVHLCAHKNTAQKAHCRNIIKKLTNSSFDRLREEGAGKTPHACTHTLRSMGHTGAVVDKLMLHQNAPIQIHEKFAVKITPPHTLKTHVCVWRMWVRQGW